MEHILSLKASATVLTIGVSLLFLVRLWLENELFGVQQAVFGSWFLIALGIQLFAHGVEAWIAGLLAQFVLAVVLVVKERMANIY